jgi:hypothetical protein
MRMFQTWFPLSVFALFLGLGGGLPAAFTTGDLKGVVSDASGASVPNAKISVISKETGETRVTSTDAQGRFALNQLKIGLYEVQAQASGFRLHVTEALVRSGETAYLSFKMELGEVSEVVTVSDAVTPLDNVTAQLQISLAAPQIAELPVQRNPNLFAGTSPGVIPVTQNNTFLGSGSYNTNGGRGRGNNITIDNITATDITVTGTGGILGVLNFSQIKEVKLITNNFNAEYGRNASSQLQYITKSGTNDFHGEAYEYLQNDRLNARDFFDRTGHPSIVRFNQFGYTLGGPLRRNKSHFFQSYEDLQQRGQGAARIAFVPTPEMLAQVKDPTAKALLDQYQLPAAATITPSGGQVTQQSPAFGKAFQFSFRLDHQFSDRDTLTSRYAHYQATSQASSLTFVGTNLANFGVSAISAARNFNLAETHVFHPAVVNEARAGFGRSAPEFPIHTTAPLGPRIIFQNGQVSSFGESEQFPQGRVQNTFEYADTLSWFRRSHNVRLGADLHRYQANSFFDALQRPVFTFASWLDFANGLPATYSQFFGSSVRGHRVTDQFYFLQDDWKVARNLTVNLGVRTEVNGGVSEVNGLISNLNLNCRDSLGAAGSGPLGCFSIGAPAFHGNTDWAPRLGFAWNPRGDAKTVIRGGYGIAYDFVFLNPITNGRFLPPFIVQGSLSGTSSFNGGNSFANLAAGTAEIQQQLRAQVGRLDPTVLNYGSISPAIDQNLRNPQVQQWNFGVEREVFHSLVIKASYVGTKGNYLERTRPLNLVNDPRAAPATSLADETARLGDFRAVNAAQNGAPATPSNRIDPRFNAVNLVDSSANSNYHAFQFLATKAFRQGYYLLAAYTFSKSIDDVSDALNVLVNDSSGQQNPRDNRNNRAVSQFDVPQRLVITHVWEPVWFKRLHGRFLRRIADGWGFAGISSFQSGFPATFESGPRRGISPASLTGGANVLRPNAAGPFSFDPAPTGRAGAPNGLNADPIQPISAYAASLGLSQPLIGGFGNLGRNAVRLNGLRNFDWNIYKRVAITERVKLQIRAEFYNIFNDTQFAGAQLNISQPAFAQYTRTEYSQRNVQVAARIIF